MDKSLVVLSIFVILFISASGLEGQDQPDRYGDPCKSDKDCDACYCPYPGVCRCCWCRNFKCLCFKPAGKLPESYADIPNNFPKQQLF
ncbi:unnamed protein product [Lupinus luteus]|uniref:Uncharacterized protein n=1 Tax=Lupinus luteus TaxID=3873 RepID=A0AAV1XIB8_LUPLU